MHALIQDGAVARYPYTLTDLRKDNPNTSFPTAMSDEQLAAFGVLRVYNTPIPEHDAVLETPEELSPVFNAQDARWQQQWDIREATQEEVNSRKAALVASITAQTQERLDAFARTRGYDGILSACTYASSSVPKFQGEGQYCVDARDATWAELYTIMAEVEAGTRPIPSSYADIESDLPALSWPA